MKNKTLAIAIALLAVSFMANAVVSLQPANSGDTFQLKGVICACKNSDGTCNENTQGAACNHNLITNAGKNATRQYLGIAGGGNFSVMALGNGSGAWNAGDKNLTNGGEIIIAASALNRTQATYYAGAAHGNWSYVKTFTADATYASINATGLYNGTAMDSVLLCEGTFTAVTLNSGDTLTINYTLGL